jgi:DNA polymerase bacteriophage-type
MIFVELDFETISLCDIKLCGAERYAEDPSTDIICLIYKVFGVWREWWPGCTNDEDLYGLANDPEVYFVAHNAAFEQAIWRHKMVGFYGFPPIPINHWRCTLAACAHKGLPLALDKAGRALKLPMDKDMDGNRLTLSMSKPIKATKASRANGTAGMLPALTPQVRRRIMDYCRQDVVVENGVKGRVGLLGKAEQKVWELDQKINQRGVRLDLKFVEAAQAVVDRASAPLRQEFQDLTGIAKVNSPKLLDWCLANGTLLDNLQKKTLAKVLDMEEDDGVPDAGYESLAGEDGEGDVVSTVSQLSPSVRRVLEIRQMLGGAAIKKLKRMQACYGYDGRARGLLQYHAAHSGRWGGRLLQPQNFPRETIRGINPEQAVEAIMSGDPTVVERDLGIPALEAIARSLRHAIMSGPGKVFIVGDYSQIEARIVLALAGQHDKTKLMADGFPVYFDMAEDIYNKPKGSWAVTDKEQLKHLKEQFIQEYTIGKNTILGCGFQMGPSKFHERYCPEQPIEFAERTVETYREVWAPKVPPLWYGLDRAALRAVERGVAQEAYGIVYEPAGEWLRCRLPNGWQNLWYYDPRLGRSRFDDICWTSMQSKQGKWTKVDMYGGLETENVVQALARGLLVEAMFRIERAGMLIVLTCHDEIMVEVDEDLTDEAEFARLMIEPTPWSEKMGIPIAAETWTGTRYRK